MRPTKEKLWTVLTTERGQVSFYERCSLNKYEWRSYVILCEVCSSAQSGKGMIQVRVAFRFSHSLRTLIWQSWPRKREFVTNTLRGWHVLLQKNSRDKYMYHASVPSNCGIFFANRRVWPRPVLTQAPQLSSAVRVLLKAGPQSTARHGPAARRPGGPHSFVVQW